MMDTNRREESKNIAILGSTGSIGTQALDVIRALPDQFRVFLLTAQNNADLLAQQAIEFRPRYVLIGSREKFEDLQIILNPYDIKVLCGIQDLCEIVTHPEISVVLTAMVGFAGLKPTLAAVRAGKDIALANKETLVVAGEMVTKLAQDSGSKILPVDSEHSAIFQCLIGEKSASVEKLILTASGGPFRGKSAEYLSTITKEQALKHPNWVMGSKITIDSASLMNKGLEVIEAKWLFNLDPSQIEVIVHPQSIVHSLVQFNDGSVKAQLGLPDMKLPIQYALSFPHRVSNNFPRFNFVDFPSLTFEQPDKATFRNLDLAYRAMNAGGNMPCVMNAANEIAVAEFLNERIGFLEMSDLIESCLDKVEFVAEPSLDDYLACDQYTRELAATMVTNKKF